MNKIIHYCWFGNGAFPKLTEKCIESWKKYCPGYEIKEWNETNADIASCPAYVRDAYEAKKYAFVSDYVRLRALYEYGGFYLDTDVELVKSLDCLLGDSFVIGFENDGFVNSGQMLASDAGHPILADMMKEYEKVSFYNPDGSVFLLGCPHVNTDVMVRRGLVKNGKEQTVDGAHVYPADWFNPLDSVTGKLNKTENTVSIHWYSMSWKPKSTKLRVKINRVLRRVFGTKITSALSKR